MIAASIGFKSGLWGRLKYARRLRLLQMTLKKELLGPEPEPSAMA